MDALTLAYLHTTSFDSLAAFPPLAAIEDPAEQQERGSDYSNYYVGPVCAHFVQPLLSRAVVHSSVLQVHGPGDSADQPFAQQ